MLHQFSFYKSVHLIINLDFYLFSDTIIDLNDFDKNVSSSISNLSEKRKFPECNFHFFSGKIRPLANILFRSFFSSYESIEATTTTHNNGNDSGRNNNNSNLANSRPNYSRRSPWRSRPVKCRPTSSNCCSLLCPVGK